MRPPSKKRGGLGVGHNQHARLSAGATEIRFHPTARFAISTDTGTQTSAATDPAGSVKRQFEVQLAFFVLLFQTSIDKSNKVLTQCFYGAV